MRAAAQPSARATASGSLSRRRGAGVPLAAAATAAATARPRAVGAAALTRRPRLHRRAPFAAAASAAEAAEAAATAAPTPTALPAPNPKPPTGTTASYSALAAAHSAAALALAALALVPTPGANGCPVLTSCLALGPASSLMAPALGACLAAASARAAGLSLFVRSAAAAAEGVDDGGGRKAKRLAASASATAAAADDSNEDDNDVTCLDPLPTELRTWRYQRPNVALLAFGLVSALAHALGLATAGLAGSSSTPAALLLPLAGLALSAWTALVAARALKWAVVDAASASSSSSPSSSPSSPQPASGALLNVAFACEPLAEALGGAQDVVEDRRIVAAQIKRQEDLEMGLRVKPEDEDATTKAPLPPPRPIDPIAAARACLAHLARDLTTFQGLMLTLTWTASVGCFAVAVFSSLFPWPRALPAVAAAAQAVAAAGSAPSDPALTYLLAAAGVAALPLVAGHAHSLCEHAAYTRRLTIPATLRASLLARLTRVARARRVRRGREARGLLLEAPMKGAVVDVELEGGGDDGKKNESKASNATGTTTPQPLFPPPPNNAPPGRFAALRAAFAAASALQLLGLVGLGASSATHLADPRFVSAQAAARAALDAADPALAALTWASLLGGLWCAGQAFGLDFAKLRAGVREVAQLASKVVDLVVRGLFWDAYWVMQNRVVH